MVLDASCDPLREWGGRRLPVLVQRAGTFQKWQFLDQIDLLIPWLKNPTKSALNLVSRCETLCLTDQCFPRKPIPQMDL